MARRIERFPRVAGSIALESRAVSFARTLAVVFFQPIESVRPEVPEERGDYQTGGVLDDASPGVEAKHLAGGQQKRRGPQYRPKPTEFH